MRAGSLLTPGQVWRRFLGSRSWAALVLISAISAARTTQFADNKPVLCCVPFPQEDHELGGEDGRAEFTLLLSRPAGSGGSGGAAAALAQQLQQQAL